MMYVRDSLVKIVYLDGDFTLESKNYDWWQLDADLVFICSLSVLIGDRVLAGTVCGQEV